MKKPTYLLPVLLGMYFLVAISSAVSAKETVNEFSLFDPQPRTQPFFYRTFSTLSDNRFGISSQVNTREMINKKFFFSLVVHPDMSGFTTIPPLGLYFERGIKSVASLGLALGAELQNESSIDYSAAVIGISARACGYILPIVAAASKSDIKTYGFEPYIGLQAGYFLAAVAISGGDPATSNNTRLGLLLGTRWYPGDRRGFALLAEYDSIGNTGRGNSFNLGITLGR